MGRIHARILSDMGVLVGVADKDKATVEQVAKDHIEWISRRMRDCGELNDRGEFGRIPRVDYRAQGPEV